MTEAGRVAMMKLTLRAKLLGTRREWVTCMRYGIPCDAGTEARLPLL